jgi:hypothetical protein
LEETDQSKIRGPSKRAASCLEDASNWTKGANALTGWKGCFALRKGCIGTSNDSKPHIHACQQVQTSNFGRVWQAQIRVDVGKEASTRWASGVDLSMLAEAGDLDPADETSREYERVVDPKYLDQIRTEAKQFSNKLLSRQSGVARSAIMNFKKGRNTIKPRTLRKLTKAIRDLQNKTMKN